VKNRRNLRLFNKPKPTKGLRGSEEKNEAELTKTRKVKLADKPGSVLALRQVTVIHLGVQLLARSSNLPADSASHAIVSLFGLATDGGYRVSP